VYRWQPVADAERRERSGADAAEPEKTVTMLLEELQAGSLQRAPQALPAAELRAHVQRPSAFSPAARRFQLEMLSLLPLPVVPVHRQPGSVVLFQAQAARRGVVALRFRRC
jgi:hypothetical protein